LSSPTTWRHTRHVVVFSAHFDDVTAPHVLAARVFFAEEVIATRH